MVRTLSWNCSAAGIEISPIAKQVHPLEPDSYSLALLAWHPRFLDRARPFPEGRIGTRWFLLPRTLTVHPICPRSLRERVTYGMKQKGVEPAFPLCIAENVIVNPFKKVKREKAWPPSTRPSELLAGVRKAGTPLLNSAQQPRGQTPFRIKDRANPQGKRLPFEVFLQSLLKAICPDSQQLALSALARSLLSPALKTREFPCLVLETLTHR